VSNNHQRQQWMPANTDGQCFEVRHAAALAVRAATRLRDEEAAPIELTAELRPIYDQERRRHAAPQARRQRRARPWEARPAHAEPHTCMVAQIKMPHPPRKAVQLIAVFLALDCPARGHRVNGGPPGRRMLTATPTIDPAPTHRGSAPARKTETDQDMYPTRLDFQARGDSGMLQSGGGCAWHTGAGGRIASR
jgi:hypothetical protein